MTADLLKTLPSNGRSQSYLDIYANQLRMGVTVSDFTITFGISEDNSPQGVSITDVAAIRLAPGTTKMLQQQLTAVIQAYEAACGTIVVPEVNSRAAQINGGVIEQGLAELMNSHINPGEKSP